MVEDLLVLDLDGQALYWITLGDEPRDLIDGIARADATVFDAEGENDERVSRLRFPDHERLSFFHNYVTRHATDLHIDRTYTLAEVSDHGYRFGV